MDAIALFKNSDFAKYDNLIIGVSGGSDSLALLLLCHEYSMYLQHNNLVFPQIICVTINHKLRKEAALEANFVNDICQTKNIKHHLITWEGNKVASNISAKARFNRYKILHNIAKDYANSIILVAHNLNDRIETFIMREKRNSVRGLATIASISLLFDNIYLWRPLLDITKQQLQHYLLKNQQNWIEDPSNKNLKYERSKIRSELGELEQESINQWKKILCQYEQQRINFNAQIEYILKTINYSFNNEQLKLELSQTYDVKTLTFTIGLLAAIMGGYSYLPNKSQLMQIDKILHKDAKLNLCRAIIAKQKNIVKIWREDRNIPQINCEAYSTIMWDNRYKITNMSAKAINIKQYIKHKDLCIKRHLAPYEWLVSGFDLPIYHNLKKIFLNSES